MPEKTGGVKVGGVLVSYRPQDGVEDNIRAIARQVSLLCIVDNTGDGGYDFDVLPDNVLLIKESTNVGIAAAMNHGVDVLVSHECGFFILFDQDTKIHDGFVDEMLVFHTAMVADVGGPVICGPNFFDRNSRTFAGFSVLKGLGYKVMRCNGSGGRPLESDFVITSGTLIEQKTWDLVGRFRDDYFIDHVDTEYCLRARRLGVGIRVNCNTVIDHSIGEREKRRLLGVVIKPNHHSHVRRYYITRNGLNVMFLYARHFPGFVSLTFARLAHEFLSIVFFERDKVKKLFAIARGAWHSMLGRMGPYR